LRDVAAPMGGSALSHWTRMRSRGTHLPMKASRFYLAADGRSCPYLLSQTLRRSQLQYVSILFDICLRSISVRRALVFEFAGRGVCSPTMPFCSRSGHVCATTTMRSQLDSQYHGVSSMNVKQMSSELNEEMLDGALCTCGSNGYSAYVV
jgi:hypothetical protein